MEIMKRKLLLILCLFFFITGCGEEDTKPSEEVKQEENPIHGTWQLKEKLSGGDFDSDKWFEVSNGYTITFMSNNNYNYSRVGQFGTCQEGLANGSFLLSVNSSSNFVGISYTCPSTDNEVTVKYAYSFENEYLILSTHSPNCDEECSYKFKRVTEQSEEVKQEESPIHGTWQLKEELGGGDFDSDKWFEVSNGYTITFMSNSNYSSSRVLQSGGACQERLVYGSFLLMLSGNSPYNFVEISYLCPSTGNEVSGKDIYSFENEYLILSPYDPLCPEGCSSKFKRVTEE